MVYLDDTIIYLGLFSEICAKCKHYTPERFDIKKKIIGTCKAFPNGIPHAIWLGENNHKKPYKGDSGIQFEEKYTIKILKRKQK